MFLYSTDYLIIQTVKYLLFFLNNMFDFSRAKLSLKCRDLVKIIG